MQEIVKKIEFDLNREYISGKILLGKLKFIEESSRKTSPYSDPRYAPFYYYLGKHYKANKVLEIGFNLGLFSSCYFMACKETQYFLGFQEEDEKYSAKLGRDNIKNNYKGDFDIHVGNVFEDPFLEKFSPNRWDLVIINIEKNYDNQLFYLDYVWEKINLGGLLVVDYLIQNKPSQKAFTAFAHGKNRDFHIFQTRYGTGILEK